MGDPQIRFRGVMAVSAGVGRDGWESGYVPEVLRLHGDCNPALTV